MKYANVQRPLESPQTAAQPRPHHWPQSSKVLADWPEGWAGSTVDTAEIEQVVWAAVRCVAF